MEISEKELKEIINDINLLEAHACEALKIAEGLKKKLPSGELAGNQKKKAGLTYVDKARLIAKKRKTQLKR